MVVLAQLQGVAYSQTPPSPEQVIAGILKAWPPEEADWAVSIAQCESHLGADPDTYTNPYHAGPFQMAIAVWRPYFEGLGYDWNSVVFDPTLNAWAAHEIYLRQGRGAWPNC